MQITPDLLNKDQRVPQQQYSACPSDLMALEWILDYPTLQQNQWDIVQYTVSL